MVHNFAFQFLLFAFLNLSVFVTSFLFTLLLKKFTVKRWGDLFLSWFIVFIFQILFSQTILGAFGFLTFQRVTFLNLLFFFFVTIIFIFQYKVRYKKIEFPSFPSFHKKDIAIFLALFSPFLILLFGRFFNALYQIPLDYDNVSYHLPFVVEWYKTGDLFSIYYSAFAGPVGYYPSNFELLDLWVMLPFGNDILVNLLNFPIFLLFIVAVYAVSRNFSISKSLSFLTAAVFLYMPVTLQQMGIPLVDLFFVLVFVISLYFFQEYLKSRSLSDLFLFALSGGIFIGTKYLGLPYLSPLLLVSIFCIFRTKSFKKIFGGFFWVIVAFLLGGGFWYIRNWVNIENPLFPTEVNLFGTQIFEGYYQFTEKIFSLSLARNVTDIETLSEFLSGFYQQLGLQIFLIILLIGALLLYFLLQFFILIIQTLRRRYKTLFYKQIFKNFAFSFLFLAGVIFYGYFYWNAPYSYYHLLPNTRYAMMFLLVCSFAVAFIASRVRFLKIPTFFMMGIAIVYNLFFLEGDRIFLDYLDFAHIAKYPSHFLLFLFSIFFIVFALYGLLNLKFPKGRVIFFLALLFYFPSLFFVLDETFSERERLEEHFLINWYDRNSTLYGITQAAFWFDHNAPNASIAYSGFNFHYHLFGRRLERNVDYININKCDSCRYREYKGSIDSIRLEPNFNAWFLNLYKYEKDYVVLAPYETPEVKNWEFEWVQKYPEIFIPKFRLDHVYVYYIDYNGLFERVKRGSSSFSKGIFKYFGKFSQ